MTTEIQINPDLRFFPATNPNPKTLTKQQLRFYNDNGYLMPLRILPPEKAHANRLYMEELLRQVAAANDGRDSFAINQYHTQCAGLWDIVTNPILLDMVEDLLGPNFVCWGSHHFCKLPREGKAVAWHQDASYWPLSPTKTVTAWLAIDKADRGNGCMRFIPRTHKLGHLKWKTSDPSEKNVLYQTVIDAEQYGEPVDVALEEGEISLHSDMLLHGSEPNLSDRRRGGLTIRYASSDVVAGQGWHSSAVLCRGKDLWGGWANVPRPSNESTIPKHWQMPQNVANAGG